MCTPVGLNATLVSQNITQVNLNIAPVSLRVHVALNDGNGNPVQLKSLQSAVCVSSLVYQPANSDPFSLAIAVCILLSFSI